MVGYEVWAEQQEIRLHTVDSFQSLPEATDVVFSGVAGYQFEGDGFQNIIFGVEEIDARTVYDQNRALFEEGQKHWRPGFWNKS